MASKSAGFRKIGSLYKQNTAVIEERGAMYLIFGTFLAGAVIGAFIGSVSASQETQALISSRIESSGSDGLFLALWNNGRFHVFALICASSFLGIAAIPALSAVRGYLLSCSAAAIFNCYPQSGLLLALTVIALPAIFTIPSFFLVSSDALVMSRKLLSLAAGTGKSSAPAPILRNALTSLFFIATAAILEEMIVPAIISAINIG